MPAASVSSANRERLPWYRCSRRLFGAAAPWDCAGHDIASMFSDRTPLQCYPSGAVAVALPALLETIGLTTSVDEGSEGRRCVDYRTGRDNVALLAPLATKQLMLTQRRFLNPVPQEICRLLATGKHPRCMQQAQQVRAAAAALYTKNN
ncbi:hypothetical protein FKM82_028553 [Ascaphus truei]